MRRPDPRRPRVRFSTPRDTSIAARTRRRRSTSRPGSRSSSSRPRPERSPRSTRRSPTPSGPATASPPSTCRASARTTRTPSSSRTFDPAAPSELLYDGTAPTSQHRRAQLPRLPRHQPARGLRRPERHLAPAHVQRRPLHQQAGSRRRAREHDRRGLRGARRAQGAADRRVDGPRLGRARVRVLLGRLRVASAPSSAAAPAAPPGTNNPAGWDA